jgi:hypothetical protein
MASQTPMDDTLIVASEISVDDKPVLVSDTTIDNTQAVLAVTSLSDLESIQSLRNFLGKYIGIKIIRHFTGVPFPGAPAIFDHAIGVAPDLEWHPDNKDNPTLETDGKITQIGLSVFLMSVLRDCHGPGNFSTLLKKVSTTYIQIIENCHLRSSIPRFKDTEKNPLFCPTRFVTQADAKTVLEDVLNDQTLERGSKVPVILIGHGWSSDEHVLKEEFKLSVPKLETIVFSSVTTFVNILISPTTQISILHGCVQDLIGVIDAHTTLGNVSWYPSTQEPSGTLNPCCI